VVRAERERYEETSDQFDALALPEPEERTTMATMVLVHGGWVGGWIWQRLTPHLRAEGHEVHAPTLTGLGERVHLGNAEVGLGTHVTDVVNHIEYEGLEDVVLVGHSYGGMVITGVLDRIPNRLAHVVYLDAFVPRGGQALADLLPPDLVAHVRGLARDLGDGWKVPLPFPPEAFGADDPADLAWLMPRLAPQPIRTQEEALPASNPAASGVPRTYIYCSERPMGLFEASYALAREGGWNCIELSYTHAGPIIAPKGLAEVLSTIAGGVRVAV
jgi:pimeloyl-ACP methyl ester carboxylesterase